MQVGDIVMLEYKGNFVNDYRLAKVTKVFPDKRSIVRTVQISYRRRDKREKASDYKSKGLVTEEVAVQRLSLLQAVREDRPSGIEP